MDGQVAEHLNKLIEAINDIKATVKAETYDVDPSISLVTPELVPPIKLQIHGHAMETRAATGAFDDIVKEFATLQIEFSKISLGEFYDLQHASMTEIWLRDNFVSYQETKQQMKAK